MENPSRAVVGGGAVHGLWDTCFTALSEPAFTKHKSEGESTKELQDDDHRPFKLLSTESLGGYTQAGGPA